MRKLIDKSPINELVDLVEITNLNHFDSGLQFDAFKGHNNRLGHIVVKVPKALEFHNVNEDRVSALDILSNEFQFSSFAFGLGFPTFKPIAIVRLKDNRPCIISEYLLGEKRSPMNWAEVGCQFSQLHSFPFPGNPMLRKDAGTIVTNRLKYRLRKYNDLLGKSSYLDFSNHRLLDATMRLEGSSLLHLDVRSDNFVCSEKNWKILDWGNSLIGNPTLELARLFEFAQIPDNNIDIDQFLAGYRECSTQLVSTSDSAYLLGRLDAALMLALVFVSENFNNSLIQKQISRVEDLLEHLHD